ncbi:hypothetical protein [Nitrospirillum iridis]|uniref:Tip attachment protein J domain-containing protein n=1 Tax=Nitrospirillum iridis TaxID=765888 RepID=A0A7X0ECA9_9PROT|nr:hypothetical protein [Nitrospirillum iridis]MBB6251443.1 hypothetical protein [Nitrospirillum iridis]
MPYLADFYPYRVSAGAEVLLPFSDVGFVTGPGDSPPNTLYERAIDVPLTETRSLTSGDTVGGYSSPSGGTITITNMDGSRNAIVGPDYRWSGRRFVLYYTDKDSPTLADFQVARTGVVDQVIGGTTITIRILDRSARFDVPATTGTFAGTGGIEGTAEMAGRGLPWAYGDVVQVSPVSLGALLIYMVDKRGFTALVWVKDGGKVLPSAGPDVATYAALAALSMSGYDYATCKALGLIRLATDTASTLIVRVQGITVSGTYVTSFPDIVRHIVTTMGDMTSGDINAASLAAFAALPGGSAALAYYHDGASDVTIRQVVDELASDVGACWGFDLLDQLYMVRFDAPADTPDYTVTDRDYTELVPQEVPRRLRNCTLGYEWHYTVLDDSSILPGAGTVPEADKPGLKAQCLWAPTATNADVAAHELLYSDVRVQTHFVNSADTEFEANRRAVVYGDWSAAYSLTMPLIPGLLPGCTVAIVDPVWVPGGSHSIVVTSVQPAGSSNLMTVTGRG